MNPAQELDNLLANGWSLDDVLGMYHSGRISQATYEAYCYWWRNLSFRYSSECQSYEVPVGATSIRPCDWRA